MTNRLALGCALWVLTAGSARADVRPLAELEALALKSRPELAGTRADGRAQSAEFARARSEFMPHFALRGEVAAAPGQRLVPLQRQRVREDGSLETIDSTQYYVSGAPALSGSAAQALRPVPRMLVELSGSASVYDFGRSSAAKDAAKRAGKAANAAELATREQVVALVRVRYLAWLAAHEVARMTADNLEDAKARRERVERLIQEGVRPKSELAMARMDELSVKLEVERAHADAESARVSLAEAVGGELKSGDQPDAGLLDEGAVLANRSALDSASDGALGLQEEAKRAQAIAEARSSRPDVRVGASVGVRAQQSYNRDDDGTTLRAFPLYGASLSVLVPLWDGGSAEAGANKARAEADSLRAERDRTKLTQLRDAAEAEIDASAASQRAATASELIDLCKERVTDLEGGFQLGAASIEQIAEARTALRRAETEYLLAKLDRAAARMRMSK